MKLIFSVMINCDLLPHFLKHYTKLGVTQFICSIHDTEEFAQLVRDKSKGYDLIIDGVFQEPYIPNEASYKRNILDKYCDPEEWVVIADLDEFHEYLPTDLDGVDYVSGRMMDRFSSDGKLKQITDEDIFQQFPVEKEYSTGCLSKVVMMKAKNKLIPGHHFLDGTGIAHKSIVKVHHFKWHAGLLTSLPIKYADNPFAWKIEFEQQMKDFGIKDWNLYWEQAIAFGILQRKNEFFKFLNWLETNCDLNSYLEIGCSGGGTSFYFNKLFKEGLSIDLVSCWNKEALQQFQPKWDQIVGNANDIKLDKQFDFIFIDGDHSYEGVKKDYEKWKDKCKIMAFHDIVVYQPTNNKDVKTFWDELKLKHKWYEIIDWTPSDSIIEIQEILKPKEWGGIGIIIVK